MQTVGIPLKHSKTCSQLPVLSFTALKLTLGLCRLGYRKISLLMPLSVQLELRYVKFFMQGLQSKNYTFCFMTRQSSIHIDSTGSNCKHILHKYNLSCSSMHKCTYTAIYKTIVTTSSQLVDAHDRVCASIMDECIQIRDRSMLCDVISSHNASEIVNCLAVA